jgi:hypothetical protein
MISFYVLWIVVISSADFGLHDYVAEIGICMWGLTMKAQTGGQGTVWGGITACYSAGISNGYQLLQHSMNHHTARKV